MLRIKLASRVLTDYYFASSTAEAVSYLGASEGLARTVAGGTELMLQIQRGELQAPHLVDISQVAALRKIAITPSEVLLGSVVTLSRPLSHEKLHEVCPLLGEAARCIGTPMLRRLATVGGNVASGWANSEVALALLALEAEAELTGYTGAQWVPMRSLYVPTGSSRIDATHELLTALRFRVSDQQQGCALGRLAVQGRPVRSPLVGVTIVSLWPPAGGSEWPTVQRAVLALGAERIPPRRYALVEDALVGTPWPMARALLADGVRDAILEIDPMHPAHQRLDEAVSMMSECFERACLRAISIRLNKSNDV